MNKDKPSPTETSKSVLSGPKANDTGKKGVNNADPDRFNGDGVSFKAKLIGVEEVPDSRGEKMCQVSMAKLKAVVVAMKEHKRQITLNVSMEGIRLLDEKTEEILYTHLVHRISFIFKDTGDSRAFGYVYHREDGVHQFFGIKTEKAADQTVACLKDLFEIVFAKKKKEEEDGSEKKEETETTVNAKMEVKPSSVDEPVLDNFKSPPPPPSSDLLGLEEQQSAQQKVGPSQSNAWIMSAFSQTSQTQPVVSGYAIGGYQGQQMIVVGQQPVGYYPVQTAMPGQQQIFQTPHQGAWSATSSHSTPFSNGYPSVGTAPALSVIQPRTTSGPTFTSPPFPASNDPFKSDPFFSPVSHTPLTNQVGVNVNQSLSFNHSSISSTASASGSMLLDSSRDNTLFNMAFSETSSQQNHGTPKAASVTSGPDPFADLANLKLAASAGPVPSIKKISKQDFNKEPPKPSLLDLSLQQQTQQQQLQVQPAAWDALTPASNGSDPFNVGQPATNPFAAITPDDPFA